jgi:hypothetical protein
MNYTVVLLMASRCPEDPETRCIMNVYGPFPSHEAAAAYAETCPQWALPHIIRLENPEGTTT